MKKLFTRWLGIAILLFTIANIIAFIIYGCEPRMWLEYDSNYGTTNSYWTNDWSYYLAQVKEHNAETSTTSALAFGLGNTIAFILSFFILGMSEVVIADNQVRVKLKEKKQKEYEEHLKNYKKTIASELNGAMIKRVVWYSVNHTLAEVELNGVMFKKTLPYPLKTVEKYIKEIK